MRPLFFVDPLINYGMQARAESPELQAAADRNFTNKPSCHLTTDGTVDDLLAFGRKLVTAKTKYGLPPAWLMGLATNHPHFDLTPGIRRAAVEHGAIEVPDAFKLTRPERTDVIYLALSKAYIQLKHYAKDNLVIDEDSEAYAEGYIMGGLAMIDEMVETFDLAEFWNARRQMIHIELAEKGRAEERGEL